VNTDQDQISDVLLDAATMREMKAIPLNDWNRALDALREGIASHDYQTAAACMKVALRLLNPCPF
jgi:hypothetical protein